MCMSHARGVVCATCMPQDKWLRCISCDALVHSTCASNRHSWQCPNCIAAANAPKSEPKCTLDVVTEGHLFDSQADLEAFLRERGYKKNNTQASGITYKCLCCSKSFYVRKSGDRFLCPLQLEHATNCTRPVTPTVEPGGRGIKNESGVHPGKTSVRYLYEFGNHPGLLEYIQTLGCCGSIRQDQLAKAISSIFNVHVEPQLLYRTATKAHEEMFGSSRSDVEELLEMEKRVAEQGGFLKLFLGALDCLTVYTL